MFASEATNLIDGQTITTPQIYMRDMIANTTTVVTQKSNGTLGNGVIVMLGGVSNDGRFVVWQGERNSNLYSNGTVTVGTGHVYVADLKDRSFMQINSGSAPYGTLIGGVPSMSCDGSFVAIYTPASIDPSDTDTSSDIYLFDIRNGLTVTNVTGVSNLAKNSYSPNLSCNGEYLTFSSEDSSFSSLVNPSSSATHQYQYDRVKQSISILDTSSSGILNNNNSYGSVSDDKGNSVFVSSGTNMIDGSYIANSQLYLKHKDTGAVEILSKTPTGNPTTKSPTSGLSISADGKIVSYIISQPTDLISSDTNAKKDVLVSETGL